MCRAEFIVDDEIIADVHRMASQGLTVEQIGHNLGWSESTLYNKAKENELLNEAIRKGRVDGIDKVSSALFKKAIDGDFPAQKFYLTNRSQGEWKDKQVTEHTMQLTDMSEANLDRKLRELITSPDNS